MRPFECQPEKRPIKALQLPYLLYNFFLQQKMFGSENENAEKEEGFFFTFSEIIQIWKL